jgi:mannose-6-phosphate isomerase-like protein (cupin superfamily)
VALADAQSHISIAGKQERTAPMRPQANAKVIRSQDAAAVSFGPLAQYRRMTGDDGLPIFTGVQTCAPGYATPLHWHPYVEYLFVLEGEMEAWLEGCEATPSRLAPGDMIALPACTPHVFRTAGDTTLRILGIHTSPTRIVNVVDANGPSGAGATQQP